MDSYLIIERVRETSLFTRLLVLTVMAVSVPGYYFYDQDEILSQELETQQEATLLARKRYAKAVQQVKELPMLEEQLGTVEKGLAEAKKYLPEKIEFDEIVSLAGQFEKELGVTIVKMKPETEVRPNLEIQYAEIPVELIVKADFMKIMTFFDRLMHTQKIMHLRNIEFEAVVGDDIEPGLTQAKASLILFRSTG
jgi:Tfp pilus assembly protein PilO